MPQTSFLITIASSAANDSIVGTSGNDVIDAGPGNDTIDGGAGNDILLGQEGDDSYVFGPGWGDDLIIDTFGANRLDFVGGISTSDLLFTRSFDDLDISRVGSGDHLKVENFFNGYDVPWQLAFDDGTVLSMQDVEALLSTNWPPEALPDFASLSEDGDPVYIGNVLQNDTDADGDTLTVTDPGTYNGTYGILVVAADGTFIYTMDADSPVVQSLAQGESLADNFEYHMTDGLSPETGPIAITISITGVNDPPLVIGEAVALTEDGQPAASGNVLANDTDSDAGTVLQIGNAGDFAGTLGDLHLEEDGDWSYLLRSSSPEVQSLGRETVGLDELTYDVTDGIVTVQGTLAVSVQGVNDAPVVSVALEDQSAPRKSNWSFTVPEGSFTDIDEGDSLLFTATLSNGDALPLWLTFDPLTGTFTGDVPPNVKLDEPLEITVTATDYVADSGSTTGSLSVSDTFMLFFTRSGNEGVGNGEEPPPPGHTYNHNDYSGSLPGSPGASGGHGYVPGHKAAFVVGSALLDPGA